jgi:hypothetical protein
VPAPELVPLGVPLPVPVALALVFVPLVVFIVLWLPPVTEAEVPEAVVDGAAEDTVLVEMMENWFE